MSLWSRLGIIASVVVLVTGYLIYANLGQGQAYYYTVDDFMERRAEAGNDEFGDSFIRISGTVAPGSLRWDPTKIQLDFVLTSMEGGDVVLPVRYDKTKPDLLQEDVEVIVEGRMGDGEFLAERVLVKCPSKYEAEAS